MEKLKGQPIESWKRWIDNELNPPVRMPDQVKYALEAFRELIEKYELLASEKAQIPKGNALEAIKEIREITSGHWDKFNTDEEIARELGRID